MYIYVNQQNLADKIEPQSVIIASEKLNKMRKDWKLIPSNSCVTVEPNLAISIRPLLIN